MNSMEIAYNRLVSGFYFDDNMKPYRKDFVEFLLKYFQDNEKYEECLILKNILKLRFNA
jgi:hypothetical protein